MNLQQMLTQVSVLSTHGVLDRQVSGVTRDTREFGPGVLFVAIQGTTFDGHDFAETIEDGIVVVERMVEARPGTTVVRVAEGRQALAECAAAFYCNPSTEIPVIGITGTNGKTTVSSMVSDALSAVGWRMARIGTTGAFLEDERIPTTLTTPEAPELQRLFRRMADAGGDAAVMEVSSIGLVMRRVSSLVFHTGLFTNLSHDHLDFHGDMDSYAKAKSMLFTELLREEGGSPRAVAWGEDPYLKAMKLPNDKWLYGFGEEWDFSIQDLSLGMSGLHFTVGTPSGAVHILSPLLGRFNALNLTAALAVGMSLGVPAIQMAEALSRVKGVRGRAERIANHREVLVVVDYAHSPDSLLGIIEMLKEVISGDCWVVFGCGGDRDKEKRPVMGRVAETHADHVVVTTDNPRSEEPQKIADQILAGMTRPPRRVILDRRSAIAWALQYAVAGDGVVIAGKGHETYQEVQGVRTPFDDCAVAAEILESL